MSHRTSTQRRTWKERALSLLLTAALLAGLIPGLTLPASAEHWADAYLDQLVDWGVMRADQTSDPDADLTRAEFFAVINRAYGYTETGYMPFEDVLETDWFYDDISIAYTAGYMAGTSATTASPNDPLTREQAFCILGRNMMLAETPGENLAFADSREISSWARGTIKAAADRYIVSGFPDNTLHPQDSISKGQMAVLVSQCLGTPIRESGAYDLGGVFGNVTITAPNVTLRNATISGDLYISGGVGLGGIKLENVDVLGRIIVSSTGESEDGSASVIMRNVTADEMLVDNMRSKTVTLRADGITDIARTVVRTNAYLEDNNTDDKGLMHIEVDGDPGLRLTLAGRIKEVVNKTPASYIQAAQGTVAKLTVDETATNSTVQIDRNTRISELNLDVATNVLGDGDIGKLNVNAPGSVVSMLPDDIYVRPGLTASIAGVIMDYQAAQEGSLDPRLLSGYPAAKDIAPTGFRADFAGNKKGTIYWGVSYVSDGSIGEDDLISPPSYGSKAVANGSVAEPAGGEEVSAQVGNLVVGGSYYLSAVLVDEMKERSPVKVVSFSTPDNTVPAFAQGYPQMSRISANVGGSVVTVMSTKSCKLYYALLPQGAKAPTANEMKAAAVTGNLGYGVRDVIKNTESVFPVNSQQLEELKTYVLYLWLTDADGAASSNVVSLSFTTPDVTAPEFNPEPTPSGNAGTTNVPLVVGLTEPGTIYWVAVPRGVAYPLPHNGVPDDNVQDAAGILTGSPAAEWSKLQLKSGRLPPEGGRAGSVRVANANTDTAMNITGLTAETAYDLYYVAMDAAGNYSDRIGKLTINTLDTTPPTVEQRFSSTSGADGEGDPRVSTDIELRFSEDIVSDLAYANGQSLLDIWAKVSTPETELAGREDLYELLSKSITLMEYGPYGYEPAPSLGPKDPHPAEGSWIDFSRATITTDNGKVIVTLTYSTDLNRSAHHLTGGTTYYFQFRNLTDSSGNKMGSVDLEAFTTVFAQVKLSQDTIIDAVNGRPIVRNLAGGPPRVVAGDSTIGDQAEVDYVFQILPLSTNNVNAINSYDVQLYTGTSMAFDVYCRITKPSSEGGGYVKGIDEAKKLGILAQAKPTSTANGAAPVEDDPHGWFYLGNSGNIIPTDLAPVLGVSVNGQDTMGNQTRLQSFPQVQTLKEGYLYDFVISLTRLGDTIERAVWTAEDVAIEVHVMAGRSPSLVSLTNGRLTPERRVDSTDPKYGANRLRSIGQTELKDDFLEITHSFTDSRVPLFNPTFPEMIEVKDTTAKVRVSLDRPGYIYYSVASLSELTPRLKGRNLTGKQIWDILPDQGQNRVVNDNVLEEVYTDKNGESITFDTPSVYEITGNTNGYGYPEYKYQYQNRTQDFDLEGLEPSTEYIIYFLLRGNGNDTSKVFGYAFKTEKRSDPKIQLQDGQDGTVNISTSENNVASTLRWIVYTHDKGVEYLAKEEAAHGPIKVPEDFPGNESAYGAPGETIQYSGSDEMGTWLYALTTPYSHTTAGVYDVEDKEYGPDASQFSIFDVFATEDQKMWLNRNIIYTTGNNTGKMSYGPAETKGSSYAYDAPWKDLAKPEDLDSSQVYIIFVSGRNSSFSDADPSYPYDSFSALDGVTITDSARPKLEETNRGEVLGAGVDDEGTTRYTSDGGLYSTIHLTFDRPLYWRETPTSTPRYAVIGGTSKMNRDDETVGFMGYINYEDDEPGYEIVGNRRNFGGGTIGVTGGRSSFYINLSGLTTLGDSMQFLGNGYFTSETGANTEGYLSIAVSRTSNTVGLTTTHNITITVIFGVGASAQRAVITKTFTETAPPAGSSEIPTLDRVRITKNYTEAIDDSQGNYSFDATLTFSGPVHYDKDGSIATAKNIVSNFQSDDGCKIEGSTSKEEEPRAFNISVTNMKRNVDYTINTERICSGDGRAHASENIIIRLTRTTSGSNGVETPEYFITVTFNGEKSDPSNSILIK